MTEITEESIKPQSCGNCSYKTFFRSTKISEPKMICLKRLNEGKGCLTEKMGLCENWMPCSEVIKNAK